MCTGGFKTLQGMNAALNEDGIDLIGLGRAAAVDPELPNRLLLDRKEVEHKEKKKKPFDRCIDYEMSGGQWLRKLVPLQLVGGSLVTKWHQSQMLLSAEGKETQPDHSFERLLIRELVSGLSGSRAVMVVAIASIAYLVSCL